MLAPGPVVGVEVDIRSLMVFVAFVEPGAGLVGSSMLGKNDSSSGSRIEGVSGGMPFAGRWLREVVEYWRGGVPRSEGIPGRSEGRRLGGRWSNIVAIGSTPELEEL